MRTLTLDETCQISAGGSLRVIMTAGMLGQILSFPIGLLIAQDEWFYGIAIGTLYFSISSVLVFTALNMLTTQPNLDN